MFLNATNENNTILLLYTFYTMSKKTVHFCFYQNFVKIPTNFNKFCYVDVNIVKAAEIVWCINIFHLT